jgi:hypothetical protein
MKVTLRYYTVAKAETYHLTVYVVHPTVLPRILAFGRDEFGMDMIILLL